MIEISGNSNTESEYLKGARRVAGYTFAGALGARAADLSGRSAATKYKKYLEKINKRSLPNFKPKKLLKKSKNVVGLAIGLLTAKALEDKVNGR